MENAEEKSEYPKDLGNGMSIIVDEIGLLKKVPTWTLEIDPEDFRKFRNGELGFI